MYLKMQCKVSNFVIKYLFKLMRLKKKGKNFFETCVASLTRHCF